MYSVVVLHDSNVFGVWTLANANSPTAAEARDIRKCVLDTVKKLDPDCKDKYTVHFSDHMPCDSWDEMKAGITASLENSIGF